MCHCKKTKKCKIACVKIATSLVDADDTTFSVTGRLRGRQGRTTALYSDSWGLPLSLGNSSYLSANSSAFF